MLSRLCCRLYGVWLWTGFWFVGRIYWTLLHFAVHCHALVSTFISSLPLLGSGLQRRIFTFFWDLELSPCLSYSSSVLTPLHSTDSRIISAWPAQKTLFLSCCAFVAFVYVSLARYCCINMLPCNCCFCVRWSSRYLATAVMLFIFL
jgi:hypothetical protein